MRFARTIIVLISLFTGTAVRASSPEIARLQRLLEDRGLHPRFRERLEERLSQLKVCEEELTRVVVRHVGKNLVLENANETLVLGLYESNDLDHILKALELAQRFDDPQDAFFVKRIGLFELGHRRTERLALGDLDKLAEILRLSANGIFIRGRNPLVAAPLNPLSGPVYAIFEDHENALTPDQRFLLASGLLAGVSLEDFVQFKIYFHELEKERSKLAFRGLFTAARTSRYDGLIAEKMKASQGGG